MHRIHFRLGIRTKLLTSFMLVAAFTGLLGLHSVAVVARLNTSRDTLYGELFASTRLLIPWLDQARVSEGDLAEYMLETDPTARSQLREEMASTDARLAALGATFDGSVADQGEAEDLASLSQAWRAYTTWRDQSIHSAAVDRTIVAFLDAKNAAANDLQTSADAQGKVQMLIAVALTAGAMLLALLIGLLLSRDIARAATQVATAAEGLAAGDLNQHITVDSGDELGQMADAVRSMIAYQHEMAAVARAMARGDLSQDVTPKGVTDVLGIAFGQMTANLRTFVANLQQQTSTLSAQAQLLELASDAIIVSDLDTGRIRFWNHGAEEAYGWTPTDALGQTTQGLLVSSFPGLKTAVDAELRRSGRWDGELLHTRQNGTHLIVSSRQTVQPGSAGRPPAVLQINTNITERKRTEEERTQLAALVERERATLASILASMTDGLVQFDQDRRIVFCNAPAAAMLGTSVMAVMGKTSTDAFAMLRPALQNPGAVQESYQTQLAERQTYEAVFNGPPERHLLVQRFAIGATGGMGVLLQDRTAERVLVRAKDELVSMVSHELASPATSLVAYASLLAENDYSESERHDMLATMVEEGQHLTAIIQDFLDIQRLEHGRFQITTRPMELRALLEHAARVAETDVDHSLTIDLPAYLPLVQANPNRVQQVLANLLSNARKYTPAHRRIWVTARQIDGAIEISVADQGLGIPLEAQPHLFDKFYRVDTEDRRLIKGTGLGLAIVREIVEALGGDIGAESAGPGHGSRFWFTLPLAEPAAGARAQSANVLRVLVVDDDDAIRNTVRRVLRPDGHQVAVAASGEEALKLCQTESFDVVLTDLGLGGGMDGWELAGLIRRACPRAQIILASGQTGIDAAEARMRGVDAVLSKPYQADDLRRLVIDLGQSTTLQQAA